MYDSEAAHAYLQRKTYDMNGYSTAANKYFAKGELEPSVFNEQCGWVDFPDDLDRTEYQREFKNGEFHFADKYVVNHKQDNIIKFVPRQPGVFKILVQQPELDEALHGDDQTPFDIELGLYEPASRRFLAQSMNRHLTTPQGTKVKLENAALSLTIESQYIGKPLYVFFRALNFTDTEGESHRDKAGCLTLYIESEFRTQDNECGRYSQLQPNS